MSSGTEAMQPDGGQPADVQQQHAAPPSPSTAPSPLQQPTTIPPQQQQLNADLVQHAQALEQQVLQLQTQLNVQPPRMRELKLPEPHEYRGTKDKTSIREWLRDIEEIFTMGGIPIDHRSSIIYAAHYLRDDAKTWYMMHKNTITTWQQFRTVMIDRYRDPREVDKVRTRLMSMRQINTVDTYTTAFDRATLEFTEVTGYAPREDELVWMYREGLKSQIKTFLAARGIINNLKQLQEITLEIDASLYNTRTSNNISPSSSFKSHAHRSSYSNTHNTNTRSRPPQYNNTFNRYQQGNRYNQSRPPQPFNRPPQFNQYNNRGYAPMDTSNSITQHKPQHVNQIDNRRDIKKTIKGNCFNCGKAGHFIRECPSNKPQINRQRSNVIMQESTTSADDTVLIINEMYSTQVPKNLRNY
jgi:Retrotransposon gag protein/Zinc knuckle